MGSRTAPNTHQHRDTGDDAKPSIGGIGSNTGERGAIALAVPWRRLAIYKGGIQFRILNSSKGSAATPRAQADRILYKAAIRRMLENCAHPVLLQQAVDDLLVEGDQVVGRRHVRGHPLRSRTVVLTAGTFPTARSMWG